MSETAAEQVTEAARLAAHLERLLREGETMSFFCEDCRQAAAELGVEVPLAQPSTQG